MTVCRAEKKKRQSAADTGRAGAKPGESATGYVILRP
jgi:hypothetical protein